MVNPIADHVVTVEQALEAARRVIEKRRAGYEPPGARWTDRRTTEAPKAPEALPTPVPPAGARSHYSSLPVPFEAARKCQNGVPLIIREVAFRFSLKPEQLSGKSRAGPLIFPRHLAMALAKAHTTQSFPQIGRSFGDRDHTTIMHAVEKMAPLIAKIGHELPHDAPVSRWIDRAIEHSLEMKLVYQPKRNRNIGEIND